MVVLGDGTYAFIPRQLITLVHIINVFVAAVVLGRDEASSVSAQASEQA